MKLDPALCLPADWRAASLVGRAWIPGAVRGPALVAIRADGVYDVSAAAPTSTDLCNLADPVAALRRAAGVRIGGVEERSRGDFSRADEIRARISREIGADLARVNRVTTSDRVPPRTYGAAALMRHLAARGLLKG